MANWRRLPGVVYWYRYRALTVFLLGALLVYVANQSGMVCSSYDVQSAVEKVCHKYEEGKVMGSLCENLCQDPSLRLVDTSPCASHRSGKELVFPMKWNQQPVYVKSAYPAGKRNSGRVVGVNMSEDEFEDAVQEVVAKTLNISITARQLESILHLTPRPKILTHVKRHLEQRQVLTLLQSQEYLLSVLFSDLDLFPQVFGTCGYLYAVEAVSPPELDSFYIFDGLHVWASRMKLAILIMDLLEQLETDFPDPLRLCDVKMGHFGLSSIGRLKYLDLDEVYTDNVLQKKVGGGQPCTGDADCDLLDCTASCNPHTGRCDLGVSNNNLQVVCEKIFVGWTLSGKLMVPGLLMTENTPASLTSLLRQCAENGRSAVPEDIRQRLYTTLTEMDQILSEQLS